MRNKSRIIRIAVLLLLITVVPFANASSFVLYSTTGDGGGVTSLFPNSVMTLDPANGNQALVGSGGQAVDLLRLTANPVNNTLYGTGLWQHSGATDYSNLYAIDPNSGVTLSTLALSQSVEALAAPLWVSCTDSRETLSEPLTLAAAFFRL